MSLEHHPIPRDRGTAPSPTHTAALAIPAERTGIAAKLGERQFLKVALPEMASNHYISLWLSGRALDSGQAECQYKSPCLCFFGFFFAFFSAVREFKSRCLRCVCMFFCRTAVRTSTAVVLLYTHGGFVGWWWWMVLSAVYCALLLYTHIVGGWVG